MFLLRHPDHDVFTPDSAPLEAALKRTTHLGIGAHPDDLEIMAFHGIAHCKSRPGAFFTGITVCNGAGSPRAGVYAQHTDSQMIEVRREEQREAARLGSYGLQIQLGYGSGDIKRQNKSLLEDLADVLTHVKPEIVYLHNPLDRHSTHVWVTHHALQALRRMPEKQRPKRVYGCEVWGDLDWLPADFRVALDVSGHDKLAQDLLKAFPSQVQGGKRYDLATLGRRHAHASFSDSHEVDAAESLILGFDLTPLVHGPEMSLAEFVRPALEAFSKSALEPLKSL